VKGVWAPINQLLYKFGDLGTSRPFLRKSLGLFLGRDFSSEQQPEKTFGQWFVPAWRFRELFLTFRDGQVSETDTFVGIQDGSFPDQALLISTIPAPPAPTTRTNSDDRVEGGGERENPRRKEVREYR